jgi:uncharacterized damage-inducible protein DinB
MTGADEQPVRPAARGPAGSRLAPGQIAGIMPGVTWTAPPATRVDGPFVGDERGTLEGFLDWYRGTLLRKCAGLSAEQLARRAVLPSSLSLIGLVRHMTEVERAWLRRRIGGESAGHVYNSSESPDADFNDAGPATAEADYDAFVRELDLARAAAAGHALDEAIIHERHQVEMSMRWIYLHVIEEYARHTGHADLIRECIDGATGS